MRLGDETGSIMKTGKEKKCHNWVKKSLETMTLKQEI